MRSRAASPFAHHTQRRFCVHAWRRLRFVIASAALTPAIALAHHSDASIDLDRVVTLEGTVTEWSLRNPHAYFSVETVDQSGQKTEWSIQMGSAIASRRAGWRPDTLSIGERVTFSANPSRDGRPYGLFVSLRNSAGIDLPISSDADAPRVAQRATSIEGKWIVDESSLVDYPDGFDELTRRDLRLTPQGAAALAEYDDNSFDNPLLNCVGRPTPGPIIYTDIYPIQIAIDEDAQTVTIRSQFFDNVRTVYMDGRSHPPPEQRFHEGHSIGRWDDGVLVVDTRNFADHRSPYQNGIPSGAGKHVVERYELTDAGTRLAVEFVLEDPQYFDNTLTHRRKLRYVPEIDMAPFNCDIESTRRFLPE